MTWSREMKVGFALAVAGITVGGGLMAIGVYQHLNHACVDTVQIISVMPGNPSQTSCAPGMAMEVENRVQGALVKCHCPVGAR